MLYFKLWVAYFFLIVKNRFIHSNVKYVQDTEVLGRALFSGHINKKGKILASAFKLKKGMPRKVSTNRLSLAPIKWFIQLSRKAARDRSVKSQGDTKFYGFAKIEVNQLRQVILLGNKRFFVSGTPDVPKNPFHADIAIQPDYGKDFDFYIIDTLINISELEKHPS